MADGLADTILRHLRKLAGSGLRPDSSDAQLLQRFALHHDEAAFTGLMARHGPLVWGVCRHILRHDQDAEDAFQATFLVLARKAGTIRKQEAVASWLHGVAYRVALRARRNAARRREQERRTPMPREESAPEHGLRELQALLDEEVQRLPEKYKAPFVLCCLEAKSRADAARALGWNEGTLSTRIAQARELLVRRLARRGVTLSAALSAAALTQNGAAATVPAELLTATARGVLASLAGKSVGAFSAQVLALAREVMKVMVLTKLSVGVTVMMVFALLLGGAGFAAWHLGEAESTAAGQATPPEVVDREVAAQPGGTPVRTNPFGDPLPVGALARLGTTRWRHEGEAQSIAFSQNGKLLAAGVNSSVVFWDPATGKMVHRLRPSSSFGMFNAMDLTPDGKIVAIREDKGSVRLWDAATGQEIRYIPSFDKQPGPPGLGRVRFSPDGKTILLMGGAHSRLLDVATGNELHQLSKGGTLAGAFTRDGKRVAVGGAESVVQVWDTATGKLVSNIQEDQWPIALAFSPDGKTLASAGQNNTITLSEAATGKEIAKLAARSHPDPSLAFTPDGQSLVSAGGGNVCIWDVASRKERFVFDDRLGYVRSLAVSPDGRTVAVGTALNVIRLLDVTTGKELFTEFQGHDATVHSVVFSPDGKVLHTGGANQQIRAWDVASGKQLRPPIPASAYALALSPDGKLLAGAWNYREPVYLWNAVTDAALFTLTPEEVKGDFRANGVTFTPDGKRLIVLLGRGRIDDGGRMQIWDPATGMELSRIRLGVMPMAAAVAPHGRTVAVGSGDGTVRLMDLQSGEEIRSFHGHKYGVAAVAFSPDGRILAGGGDRNQVILWETGTGKEIARLEGEPRFIASIAFSPDGRVLAGGTGGSFKPEEAGPCRIYFWDVATGNRFTHLETHDSKLTCVAFAPDGRTLASSHHDGTVLIWDVSDRFRIQP